MSLGSYTTAASAAIAALWRVSYRLTGRTDTPRVRLFRSLPLRPEPQSGCESAYACGYGPPLTAFAGAHTACAALQPNAQSSLSCNACGGLGTLTAVNRLVLHSHSLQAQHSHCVRGCPCCDLMTYSCAVAHLLPCLHFTAHRHRLNTKLRRKQVEPHFRQTFFGEPKISKSGIGKRERNQYCVLVISRTPASSPHNALHIPLG